MVTTPVTVHGETEWLHPGFQKTDLGVVQEPCLVDASLSKAMGEVLEDRSNQLHCIDNLHGDTKRETRDELRRRDPPLSYCHGSPLIRRLFFGITKVPGHVWTSVVCDVLISVCGVRIIFL